MTLTHWFVGSCQGIGVVDVLLRNNQVVMAGSWSDVSEADEILKNICKINFLINSKKLSRHLILVKQLSVRLLINNIAEYARHAVAPPTPNLQKHCKDRNRQRQ